MKVLKVCIGSACHLKGSYDVIGEFKKLIAEKGLEGEIELNASFCLGECTNAVSVECWNGKILSVSKENAREIFERDIITNL